MAFRLINFYSGDDLDTELLKTIEDIEGVDGWNIKKNKDDVQYSFLVQIKKTQEVTDKLQPCLNKDPKARIVVLPVVTTMPDLEEEKEEAPSKKKVAGISREELYVEVAKGAELDRSFMMLVFFSTVVAAIGLLESNVAVVIGAMVIAPLLGPNLAFALATVLADVPMMKNAARTNFIGILFAIFLSLVLGVFWSGSLEGSQEFMSRTDVGFSGIVLAIASGAAAVLSLVTGVSSALVGVMVAVALMPPAVVFGVSLGSGEWSYAFGSFLLLAANIICVNLSAMWVLIYKGVQPRTWKDKKQARMISSRYLSIWLTALGLIVLLLIVRTYFFD